MAAFIIFAIKFTVKSIKGYIALNATTSFTVKAIENRFSIIYNGNMEPTLPSSTLD